MKIISRKSIKNGNIQAEISPSFAEYLLKHIAMTNYPQALIGIDGRHTNAYYLGLKIAEHWHIYRNQEKGTSEILSIRTLLECADFPSIEKVREQRTSWQQKILEPFFQALDYLKDKDFLNDWNLVKAKSEELTPKERNAIYSGK